MVRTVVTPENRRTFRSLELEKRSDDFFLSQEGQKMVKGNNFLWRVTFLSLFDTL